MVLVLVVKVLASVDDEVWCRNPAGERVEWFIMYKVPKTASENKRSGRYDLKGSEFGYVDAESTKNSPNFLDGVDGVYSDVNNPLAKSLNRLFQRQKVRSQRELTYIVYNDQAPPDISNASTNGHTKGVVLFGQNSGIWIVHSVPKFPDKLFSGKYSFPENARENGQTIMCVTFEAKELDTIASHLRRQYPNMYVKNAPSEAIRNNPQLGLLLQKNFFKTQPFLVKDILLGIKGTAITAFAKHGRLNKDIYSGVIAPMLETDLYVESWRNGNGGKLPPDCFDKFKVTDIQRIAMKVGEKTMRFSSHEDHSKWAVGDKGFWVCIGSINRMLSQFKRGGETFCFQNPLVHSLFASSMVEYTSCNIQGLGTRSRSAAIDALSEDKENPGGSNVTTTSTPKPSSLLRSLQAGFGKIKDELKRSVG